MGSRACRRSGVTLAEVVLAIGVLAIVGLTIIGVFTKLLGSQSKSSHDTVGRFILEAVAERAVLAGPPNWGMTDPDKWEKETTFIHSVDAEVTFEHTIPVRLALKDAPATNPMGKLYFIEIHVRWWNGVAHAGMGQSELSTTRVVYVGE